jgi:hypothetical protein
LWWTALAGMLTLTGMLRSLTSLVLTTVLLVCPFLCRTGSCCAGVGTAACAETSRQIPQSLPCCTLCQADDAGNAGQADVRVGTATESPQHSDPCPPPERCADPCLCNGAVLSLTDANTLPDRGAPLPAFVPAGAVVAALDIAVLAPAFLLEPPSLSGRDIRHARMSLLI